MGAGDRAHVGVGPDLGVEVDAALRRLGCQRKCRCRVDEDLICLSGDLIRGMRFISKRDPFRLGRLRIRAEQRHRRIESEGGQHRRQCPPVQGTGLVEHNPDTQILADSRLGEQARGLVHPVRHHRAGELQSLAVC